MMNLYYEEMLYPNFQPLEVWGSHPDNDVFVFSLFSIENNKKTGILAIFQHLRKKGGPKDTKTLLTSFAH